MDFPLSSLLLLWSGVILATLGNARGDGYPLKVSYGEQGVNCDPVDSCEKVPGPRSYGVSRRSKGRNCRCDDACGLECCFDAEFKSSTSRAKLKENEKCIIDDAHEPAYMVDTCGRGYAGDSLCTSSGKDNDDPLLMIPVTSTATGTTYKNYFCALCNEDVDDEHLEPWNLEVVVRVRSLEEFSLTQLKYNRATQAWMLVEGNSSVTVYVTAMVPDSLQSTVVPCKFRLVDRCAHNWSDANVEAKCNSYMSLVEDKTGLRYRNPYCAICNYVDIEDIDCVHLPGRRRGGGYGGGHGVGYGGGHGGGYGGGHGGGYGGGHGGGYGGHGGVGFRLIKLFYLKDKRCEKDMVYDKFHDVCRCNARISIMKDGKCVYKIPEMKERKKETE
ncbi:uncharacterized protein CDAR_181771 [Caerostris darwini]|uniref:Uncharacterized protein n=1 Tax=Caerostris darwini TaxID=1538125 RepID=A0AAV4URJ9_9ARAC|nr:uncharacterized protein CDAR_181771 [Caerostris darwini]